MKFSSEKPQLPSFQITPMLDVVFLLLCFFVTTSVYSQWESEVNIKLPTAKKAEAPQRLPGEVIVNLTADGKVIINRRELTFEELGRKCALLARDGHKLILRADKDVRYEYVMKVLDICKQCGLWNISFATEMLSEKAND